MFKFAHELFIYIQDYLLMKKVIYPNRLRVILAEKQRSNRWLAEELNVCEMTVSRWSTNKTQPSISQLIEIAKLLEVTLEDLMEQYRDEQ